MADNIHDVQIDPRNLNILISVNGKLTPRAEAMVSVFDSGFILGDGVWYARTLGATHLVDVATLTGACMVALGHDVAPLRSKSWEEFAGIEAPRFDFIIALCPIAACPKVPAKALP